MEFNVSLVSHLIVNRIEVIRDGCSACGGDFTPNRVTGARALCAVLQPANRIHVFCATCGDSITGHVDTEAVRQHYVWDWILPLRDVIGESALAAKMVRLADTAPAANDRSFQAFGKTYESERTAIIDLLRRVHAGEANGSEAFAGWASVCTTDWIKTGLRMIAEREVYHARIFGQRLLELGSENDVATEEKGSKFKDYLGDPKIPDEEKLLRFIKSVGDPDESIKSICYFAGLIKEDIQTKEALLLFAEDELSSMAWFWKSFRALHSNGRANP